MLEIVKRMLISTLKVDYILKNHHIYSHILIYFLVISFNFHYKTVKKAGNCILICEKIRLSWLQMSFLILFIEKEWIITSNLLLFS